MSGFDVQMRSQQMVQQNQQFYDSQRYQSMAQTGQTIAQAPAMLQEIAIRQQDADMRLALQQQEFQGNQMKLQAMMAIDQSDMSREQVRAMKLQNDSIAFDMKMREKQMGIQQSQTYAANEARIVAAFGGENMWKGGLGYDKEKGGIYVLDKDSYNKKLAEFQKSSTDDSARQEMLDLSREMTTVQEAMDRGSIQYAEGQKRIASIAKRMASINESKIGPGSDQGGKGQSTNYSDQTQQPSTTPEQQRTNDDQVRQLTAMLMPLGQGGSPYSPPTIGVDRLEAIAKFMVDRKDELHQKAGSVQKGDRKNMMVGKDADETVRMYLSELRNPNSPWRAGLLTSLVRGGVITPEEAQKLMDR